MNFKKFLMRNISFRSFFLLAVTGTIVLAACSKKLDEAYQNPNASTTEPIENLLPGVIGCFVGNSAAAGSGYGLGGDALVIGRYIQYWGDFNGQASANVRYDE